MSKVCAKWVPKMLIPEQKQARVEACQQLLHQVMGLGDVFLQHLVTQDEPWFYLREPESKQDSMVWKHPSSSRPSKFKVVSFKEKVLYLFFWDHQGVLMQ